MFEKITKERFLQKTSDTRDNIAIVMCPAYEFNETVALHNFSKNHEKSLGGHIIIHDEVGRTVDSIYLWKKFQ